MFRGITSYYVEFFTEILQQSFGEVFMIATDLLFICSGENSLSSSFCVI